MAEKISTKKIQKRHLEPYKTRPVNNTNTQRKNFSQWAVGPEGIHQYLYQNTGLNGRKCYSSSSIFRQILATDITAKDVFSGLTNGTATAEKSMSWTGGFGKNNVSSRFLAQNYSSQKS